MARAVTTAFISVAFFAGCSSTTVITDSGGDAANVETHAVSNLSEADRATFNQSMVRGDEAMRTARWEEAAASYETAIRLVPHHPRARSGYDLALARIDRGSVLDLNEREIRLRRQSALAEFDQACIDAQSHIQDAEFAFAEARVLNAMLGLERSREFLTPQEFHDRDAIGDRILAQIDQARALHRLDQRAGG